MNDRRRRSPEDLLEYGFKVTGTWVNMKTITTMKCQKCGDERPRRPSNIINDGTRCSCTKKKMKDLKTKQEEFRNLVENQGYTLFDEYTRSDIHVTVQCDKGHPPYKVLPLNFKANRRCKECSYVNMSGELSLNWNPNLTEEDRRKKRPGVRSWSRKVKIRDKYTCQNPVCNHTGKRMHAHHLISWETSPENRFNIDNGVTLCDTCHSKFHMIFGLTNNTKEQFMDWVKLELNQTEKVPKYNVVKDNQSFRIMEVYKGQKHILILSFDKQNQAKKIVNQLNKNVIKCNVKNME